MRLQVGARKARVDTPSALSGPIKNLRPHWEPRSRQLTVRGLLLKWQRGPARNQDLLFAALEEQGWPACIDDPLPPRQGGNPKHRLRKAIEKLNHGLHPALRFYGNGTGQAVCWCWTEHASALLGHASPVWRQKADFLITAKIITEIPNAPAWEQLWARQVSPGLFEVCCIPFFLYDVSLGDVVKTESSHEKHFVFKEVCQKSGRFTFRIWFQNANAISEFSRELTQMGCLIEQRWEDSRLFAVDAESDLLAREVANLLSTGEKAGVFTYETGRTKDCHESN